MQFPENLIPEEWSRSVTGCHDNELRERLENWLSQGMVRPVLELFEALLRERSERASAEEALRLSEQRFAKAFHANPTPMGITRICDGVTLDINDASVATLGYSRDEIVGKTSGQLGLIDPALSTAFRRAAAMQVPVRNLEVQVRTKSGALRDMLASTEWIELDGEMCMLSSALDITERKLAEAQVRQSQKLEVLGQLAGGVAHDFNNLLTSINGYSDLALTEIDSTHPLFKCLCEIQKAGQRATALTRQLLVYSRKQSFAPRAWNLNLIVSEMQSMLQRLISEEVQLETRLAPDARPVKVDRGQVEQVVLNLALNARDAMKTGGNLTIATANVDLQSSIPGEPASLPAGAYVRLSIADTGVGMSPEVQRRIFEPFFTTKEAGKGTGLGLSVVSGIVAQSGGSIAVHTDVAKGSTFEIFFPIAAGTEAACTTADQLRSTAAFLGRETILLVEDEESVRRFTCDALESLGYTVLSESNPYRALQTLRAAATAPHLMITDVVMPDMGGPELVENARRIKPSLPVLFVSGYPKQTGEGDAALHEDIYLQKPFERFELGRKVRQILDSATGA